MWFGLLYYAEAQQILACDLGKCFMFDVLKNVFVLAQTLILSPVFVLEWPQQSHGLITKGVSAGITCLSRADTI